MVFQKLFRGCLTRKFEGQLPQKPKEDLHLKGILKSELNIAGWTGWGREVRVQDCPPESWRNENAGIFGNLWGIGVTGVCTEGPTSPSDEPRLVLRQKEK